MTNQYSERFKTHTALYFGQRYLVRKFKHSEYELDPLGELLESAEETKRQKKKLHGSLESAWWRK